VIDVRLIRTDYEGVRAALARRHKPEVLAALERAAALDTRLRDITSERDGLRARVNALSKQVGEHRRQGRERRGRRASRTRAGRSAATEKLLADEHDEVSEQLRQELLAIPNLPHPDAPDGMSDADNPVVRGPFLSDPFADYQRVPHWETATALGILDNERAAKIAQSMWTMQRGAGATMARALCQLALDRNADAFEEIRPPTLVSTATLTSTGQLPKFADDAFAIERDDCGASPPPRCRSRRSTPARSSMRLSSRCGSWRTAPCYRREAGSAGRDTRGMLRAHEFDKVEILALATAEQAPALLEEMVGRAESTIAELELPYRIIEICTGDMGQTHHRSFDIEVYAPGAEQWLEVSSISWFSDYQARRANIRYRPVDADGRPRRALSSCTPSTARHSPCRACGRRSSRTSATPTARSPCPTGLRAYMRGISKIA
jgi:seryl-tRNA synthetase